MNPLSADSLPTLSRRALMGMSGLAVTDMLTRQAWAKSPGTTHSWNHIFRLGPNG